MVPRSMTGAPTLGSHFAYRTANGKVSSKGGPINDLPEHTYQLGCFTRIDFPYFIACFDTKPTPAMQHRFVCFHENNFSYVITLWIYLRYAVIFLKMSVIIMIIEIDNRWYICYFYYSSLWKYISIIFRETPSITPSHLCSSSMFVNPFFPTVAFSQRFRKFQYLLSERLRLSA